MPLPTPVLKQSPIVAQWAPGTIQNSAAKSSHPTTKAMNQWTQGMPSSNRGNGCP
jgi:hypothetical protein